MLYFSIQNCRGVRTGKVSEAAGARWRFYPRIILDYPRIVFILAEALEALLPEIFHFKIMWQAQYLVKVECDFMWQAQYLVKVECDFMWQAQYLVTFWEIAGPRNVVFFNTKLSRSLHGEKVSEAAGARWRFYPRIILDYPRIVFILAEALEALLPEIFHFKIMWQAQYLVKVECDFMWQAQYLVKVECDFMWQAQYLVTFWEIAGPRNVVFFNTKLSRSSHGEGLRSGGCEMTILSSDYPRLSSNRLYIGGSTWGTFTWDLPLQDYVAGAVFGEGGVWLYVAGAVFGEGGVWLFVAGAALRDILGGSRSAKCCILQYKIVAKIAWGRSPKRRVRDDDFIVGCPRISSDILGLSSNRLYIGGSNSGILRGNPELRISWQAQYLVE